MKLYTDRHVLITRLAVLVLFTLSVATQPVMAQYSGTHLLYQDIFIPSVGLAPGQSLRFTLFNPDGAPVRAQVKLHHTGGVLVALGDGSVRSGAFHSFDFKRSDILLPGEAGTGRIQLRGSVRLTFSEAINPLALSPIVVSMETITDGTSNTVFFVEIPPSRSGGGRDVLLGGNGGDYLMGIAPGQKLRVTLFNPPSSESETRGASVGGHVKVFNGSGNLIAQSPELAIPPGEFRSFDFDRHELNLPGEPGTDRAHVRMEPVFNFSSKRLARGLASVEIVDNSTGKTTVLSGQQCLVFYLGGTPGN